MKSLLAVPIANDGTVYGRVYLCDKLNGEPFHEDDEAPCVRIVAASNFQSR
jgi:GAF domain-containing protein